MTVFSLTLLFMLAAREVSVPVSVNKDLLGGLNIDLVVSPGMTYVLRRSVTYVLIMDARRCARVESICAIVLRKAGKRHAKRNGLIAELAK